MKSKAAVLWGSTRMEGRGDRARPAEGRRGAGRVEGRRAVPLRRAPRHRRHGPAAGDAGELMGLDRLLPDHRRPRGRRRRRRGRPGRHQRAAGRPRRRPAFIPSCGRCRYCSTGRQNLCDLGAGTFVRGHDHRRHRPPPRRRRRTLNAVGQARHVRRAHRAWPRRRSSRSTTTCRSTPSRSCRAASPPAGARPSSGPTSAPATPSSWSASAASASTPCRAPRWPAPSASSPSTRSSSSGRRRWSSAPPTRSPRWRRPSPAVTELTWGQMADKVIMTPGVLYGDMMAGAMTLAGKGGTIVVTAVAPMTQTEAPRQPVRAGDVATRRSRARSSARSTRAPTSPSCSACTARASSSSTS